jgi:hypothetical protein
MPTTVPSNRAELRRLRVIASVTRTFERHARDGTTCPPVRTAGTIDRSRWEQVTPAKVCPVCERRLSDEPSARTATDPVNGHPVDKAPAVICKLRDGRRGPAPQASGSTACVSVTAPPPGASARGPMRVTIGCASNGRGHACMLNVPSKVRSIDAGTAVAPGASRRAPVEFHRAPPLGLDPRDDGRSTAPSSGWLLPSFISERTEI